MLVGKSAEHQPHLKGKFIQVGTGIGQRQDPKLANAVHVALIDEGTQAAAGLDQDAVWELAANLDDMTPESSGHLTDELRRAGALDVWQCPAFFKKGRSGSVVHALCTPAELQAVETTFFLHSRSLGIRRQLWQRSKLHRELHTFESSLGTVHLKCATKPDGSQNIKVEYDDCARISSQQQRSMEQMNNKSSGVEASKS